MKFITIALVVQFLISCWSKTNLRTQSYSRQKGTFDEENLCLQLDPMMKNLPTQQPRKKTEVKYFTSARDKKNNMFSN